MLQPFENQHDAAMNYSRKALQDGQVPCQDVHSEGCYKPEIGMWRELMGKISKIISSGKKKKKSKNRTNKPQFQTFNLLLYGRELPKCPTSHPLPNSSVLGCAHTQTLALK